MAQSARIFSNHARYVTKAVFTVFFMDSSNAPYSVYQLMSGKERWPVLLATFLSPLPIRFYNRLTRYVTTIWHRVYQARIPEARNMAQRLVQDLTLQIEGENDPRHSRLAQLHHGAGFVTSIQTRSSLIAAPLAHYQEMERIARLLADETRLTLALAYQGDLYCRGGKVNHG